MIFQILQSPGINKKRASAKMFRQALLFSSLIILEGVYSLPLEEKIEPVELFHKCIEPEKDENEPDKSSVLMLHGVLGTYRNYEDLGHVIAKRTKRKACAVDLRNHGDSPWNNRTDIAALAVDIGHFLDMHNIKKVNLIGESLGGKVAIHYTLNNPDRVESIVVEEMRPNTVRKTAVMSIKLAFSFLKAFIASQPEGMDENEAKKWTEKRAKEMLHQMEIKNVPENLTKYMDFILIDGKWQPKHNMELMYEKIKNKPLELWTESSGLYTGPALFVYGTESVFEVGDDKDNILKLFPNAKLHPIEGASHIIHEFHPEFDDIVVKFLNEIN